MFGMIMYGLILAISVTVGITIYHGLCYLERRAAMRALAKAQWDASKDNWL